MTATVSSRQIAAIHTLAKSLGLDDDLRRAVIAAEAGGKRSSKELTFAEAGRVIERLKHEQTKGRRTAIDDASTDAQNFVPPAKGSVRLDGPYAGKLRALWISGWNLGVVRDRTDRALLAFLERQTGVSHPRFLREPRQAWKAIEGLKAWIAREADVDWPPANAGVDDVKRAVIAAQSARLLRLGIALPAFDVALALDDQARGLGLALRAALARTNGGR